MESHILHHDKQRFEPKDKVCLFCKKSSLNRNMEDNLFTPVYAVQDRTNLLVYSNVKFKKIDVGVPRCENCRRVHSTVSIISNIAIFFAVITTLVLPIYLSVEFNFSTIGLVIALALTFGVVVLIAMGVEKGLLAMYDVRSKKDGSLKDPLIKEFLRGGWSLKRPTA